MKYKIKGIIELKEKEKLRNCCYCGKDTPMSEWQISKIKGGTETFHHKNCKWKSPI